MSFLISLFFHIVSIFVLSFPLKTSPAPPLFLTTEERLMVDTFTAFLFSRLFTWFGGFIAFWSFFNCFGKALTWCFFLPGLFPRLSHHCWVAQWQPSGKFSFSIARRSYTEKLVNLAACLKRYYRSHAALYFPFLSCFSFSFLFFKCFLRLSHQLALFFSRLNFFFLFDSK